MTAREKARQRVTSFLRTRARRSRFTLWMHYTDHPDRSVKCSLATVGEMTADAASDVWEPLLREALEWAEGLDLGLNWDGQERIVNKIKEALGE